MNIELEEVVVQDVSDEALEMAAGGVPGGTADRHSADLAGVLATAVLAPAAPVTYNLGVCYEH